MNYCSWETGYDVDGEAVLCGKPAWQKVGKWWYCDYMRNAGLSRRRSTRRLGGKRKWAGAD